MSGIDMKKIDEALKNFNEALKRLQGNRHFRNYEINSSLLFALMVKESFLDNTRVSVSWAKGYFQMKWAALEDAKKFIKDELKIRSKEYSLEDPVESIILWIAYFLNMSDRIESLSEKFEIKSQQQHILTLLAYNLGIGDTGRLVTIYYDETKKEVFDWDEFVVRIVSKLWISWGPSLVSENVYKTQYRDWFIWKDLSKYENLIRFSSSLSLKKSKLQEMINYIEKIQGIMSKWWPKKLVVPQNSLQITRNNEIKFERQWEKFFLK